MRPLRWLNQRLCPHLNAMMRHEAARLLLHCDVCGYESPGWTVAARPDPQRPVVTHKRLPKPNVVRMPTRRTG
jgi:hypothetical protein